MAAFKISVVFISVFSVVIALTQGFCDCDIDNVSDKTSEIGIRCNSSARSSEDEIKCNLVVLGAKVDENCTLERNEFEIMPAKRGGQASISCVSTYQIDINYDGPLPQLSFELKFIRKLANFSQYVYETIATIEVDDLRNATYYLFSIADPKRRIEFALNKMPSSHSESASFSATSSRLNLSSLIRREDAKSKDTLPFMVCSSNLESRIQRLINVHTKNTIEARYKLDCLFKSQRCFNKWEGSMVDCDHYGSHDYSCKHIQLKPPGGLVSCFVDGKISEAVTKEYFIGLDNKYHFKEDWLGGFLGVNAESIIRLVSVPKEIIIGTPIQLSCDYIYYVLVESVAWFARYKDGRIISLAFPNASIEEKKGPKFTTSVLNATLSGDVEEVICTGFFIYSNETRNASMQVNVVEGVGPRIVTKSGNVMFSLGSGNGNQIKCEATGTPLPEFEWFKLGYNFSEHALVTNGTDDFDSALNVSMSWTLLTFPNSSNPAIVWGDFECIANNKFGQDRKILTIHKHQVSQAYFYGTLIGIPVTASVIIVLLGISAYLYWNRHVIGLTKEEIQEFMKGRTQSGDSEKITYLSIVPETLPYNPALEVSEDNLSIDFKNVLGSGAHGLVLKGFYKKTEVAIKTLKSDASKEELKSLLAELKLMVYIGPHPHVSSMVGAVTKHLSSGKVYVVLEFYKRGSLESYLRKNLNTNMYGNINPEPRYTFAAHKSAYKNIGILPTDEISFRQLCLWSFQIADGLEHLSRLKVVHGDLAARNILLDEHGVAKISDFGLSRKLYEYAKYVKQSQEPLPWRWMAIESLRDLSFSIQSDIWSFGVTMWEIFSMSAIPYPGMTWTTEFMTELSLGMRLNQPNRATPAVYELILKCWNISPQFRPTSEEVKESLRNILADHKAEDLNNINNSTNVVTSKF